MRPPDSELLVMFRRRAEIAESCLSKIRNSKNFSFYTKEEIIKDAEAARRESDQVIDAIAKQYPD